MASGVPAAPAGLPEPRAGPGFPIRESSTSAGPVSAPVDLNPNPSLHAYPPGFLPPAVNPANDPDDDGFPPGFSRLSEPPSLDPAVSSAPIIPEESPVLPVPAEPADVDEPPPGFGDDTTVYDRPQSDNTTADLPPGFDDFPPGFAERTASAPPPAASPPSAAYVVSFASPRAPLPAALSSSDEDDDTNNSPDDQPPPDEPPTDEAVPDDEPVLPDDEPPGALPRAPFLGCVRGARPPPPDLSGFDLLTPLSTPAAVPLEDRMRRFESAVDRKSREAASTFSTWTQALTAQFDALEEKCAALETSLRCYAKVARPAAPRSPLAEVIERRSLPDLAAFIDSHDPDSAFAPPAVSPRQLFVLIELLCAFAPHERYGAVASRWVIAGLTEIDARDPSVKRQARPAVLAAAKAFGGGDSVSARMVFHLSRALTAELA